MDKPKLNNQQIVEKMKTKGIKFNIINEEEAINYLTDNNNYYRLASYRKNYDKYLQGKDKGKYIHLEFAHLKDLAIIDMRFRFIVIKMCLDIEHSLKVKLLSDITNNKDEDGYSIVRDFINKHESLKMDILQKSKNTYVGDIINKNFYFEYHKSNSGNIIFDDFKIKCPIWAYLEIIDFGTLLNLLDFYYFDNGKAPCYIPILKPVKSLRNACAHNNCVLHDLKKSDIKPPRTISQFVSRVNTISKQERQNKLSNRPIFEAICLLYAYNELVKGPIRKNRIEELQDLINNRCPEHKEYYKSQQIISTSYKFFKKIVDFYA